MDSSSDSAGRLYGYDTVNIGFEYLESGEVKLSFEPVEKLPTAEAIEKAYDHSAPIEEQHIIPRVEDV